MNKSAEFYVFIGSQAPAAGLGWRSDAWLAGIDPDALLWKTSCGNVLEPW